MKHTTVRLSVFAVAFVMMLILGIYFIGIQSEKSPAFISIGEIVYGSLAVLAGFIVLLDTYYDFGKGFAKRETRLNDTSFLLSYVFVIAGFIAVLTGITDMF